MDEQLGTLHEIDGALVLRFERHLRHPVQKVWRAVTDPERMAHWFPARVHTELRAGASMRFTFGNDLDLGERYAQGEVIEVDPPKLYVFRWLDQGFRIELLPTDQGCTLVFSVTLRAGGTVDDRPSIARAAPGWDVCLDTLLARLDGTGAPDPAGTWRRAEQYVERFGLGAGTVTGGLLRFERDLTQPPATVWAALTEAGVPEPGAAPPPRAVHAHLRPGSVAAAEEPRLLEYALDGGATVRFELRAQEPIGCRLVLTQTAPGDPDATAEALAAWQAHLELFFAALHGEPRRPWPARRVERLRQRYAREV